MNKTIKKISSIAIMASMFGFIMPAMAQTTSTNDAASITTVTATTTEIKVNKAEEKMQIVRNVVMRLANRLDVNIRNLESLSARISARINKIDQTGKDTTQAKAKLNEANAKIQEAKDALIKLQQGVETAITSANPKKNFAAAKDKLTKAVMDKIKAAHKALVETIVILAKVSQPLPSATSTLPSNGTSTQLP